MLPIAVPALTGGEHRQVQTHFGAEDLILVLTPETVFESADLVYRLAPHQQAGRHRRFVSEEAGNQRRRPHECVGRYTEALHEVTLAVLSPAGPAIPPF